MMKKNSNLILETIRIFCLLGLALQVLLGLWYLITNIDTFRDVLQVCFAVVSVYSCMRCFVYTPKAIFSSFVINTIPFVLQAHLSNYVYSAIFSVTFLVLGYYKKKTIKNVKLYSIIIAVLFPIGMLFVAICGKETSSLKSAIGMTMVERFAWPNIERQYKQWMPEEISVIFTDGDLRSIAQYPYRIEADWQPRLVEAIGEEETFRVNIAVAKMGIEQCSKLNLKNIVTDTLAYASPLLFMDDYLVGEVDSATSFNYQMFMDKTPSFASDYFWIMYRLVPYMFYASLLCLLYHLNHEERARYIKRTVVVIVWLIYMGAMLALQGTACFDYKQTLIQQTVIYGVILYFIEKVKGDENICFK